MSVTLTIYGIYIASTTLPNACTFATATGATVTSRQTTIGTKSGYGQVAAQPGTSWPATTQSSIGAPDGNGWLYDVTTLESGQLVAGVWTAKIQLTETNNKNFIGDLYCRFYVYNSTSLTYTAIGQASQTAITFSTVTATYTLTSGSLGAVTLGAGDKLYVDVWINVTTPSASTFQGIFVRMGSSATQGIASTMEIDTPGVQFVRIIPCNAALAALRTIPCSASLSGPSTRVIVCDSALSLTQTRTIVCDSALQATVTRTIPATGAIYTPDLPRTIPVTGALSRTQTRTIPASASLGGGFIRTIPASVALIATQSRTIGCTASLAWPPFTRFPTVSRRTGMLPFAARRTGLFPQRKRRES